MRKIIDFFEMVPLAIYVKNAAKMANPISEYMPAHAMSIANAGARISELSRSMTGAPYSVVRLTGRPSVLRIVYTASELNVARVVPAVYTAWMGGGIRNSKKAKGKARVRRVCVLNIIRMVPAMKSGREAMWYSRG